MTTHTIGPRPHLTAKAVGLGLGAGVLALGAAYGITTWEGAGGRLQAPAQSNSDPVITEGARDSWEGRIGPGAGAPGDTGVRDSWMPPGATDLKLRKDGQGLR